MFDFPEGKRYNTSAGRYRRKYGERLQKLVLDAGFSCPNRDGTLGTGGCSEALSHPSIVGLVIGTRPDCVDEEKLDWLAGLKDKVVVVEYGIESCYDRTLERINRGHGFECARKAVEMTAARGIDVGAHFILGLPGETRQMLLDQCSTISSLPLTSVKFHQLQIVKGTRMEKEYSERPEDFLRLGLDDYLDLVTDILERLRPNLCIERVAGEVPPRFVNETPWGLIRNDGILRLLDKRLEERDSWQGRLYDIDNK